MGRKVMRVALDFEHPLNKVWPGYVDEPEYDPPEGPGYQLWETVSEGSPISPVFAAEDELADWMTKNRCTVNGPMPDHATALKFVRAGWAPSMVSMPGMGIMSGAEWIGRTES